MQCGRLAHHWCMYREERAEFLHIVLVETEECTAATSMRNHTLFTVGRNTLAAKKGEEGGGGSCRTAPSAYSSVLSALNSRRQASKLGEKVAAAGGTPMTARMNAASTCDSSTCWPEKWRCTAVTS